MNKILMAALIITLVGCASISDLRGSGPRESFSSKKPSTVVAECILAGWQENSSRYGDVYLQPYGDGYTVLSSGNVEFVDIKPDASGVGIKFYHQDGIFQYRTNARVAVINKCI
ncbi:hypothetical protein [Yersinia proxima]|uniref:hypothetical protein n=1 Tax=Yersinia proxima TaxID=2890316 RepID=UPI0009820A28|nr:hypothetical protein [Yersinia proxima]